VIHELKEGSKLIFFGGSGRRTVKDVQKGLICAAKRCKEPLHCEAVRIVYLISLFLALIVE